MKKVLIICLYFYLSFVPLYANNWHGKWIQAEGVNNYANTWQVFRKEFLLDEIPTDLPTRIAVDTKYWLWVNDSLIVFEGGLKRGPDPTSTYYDTLNLTPYLRKGNNVIAMLTCYYGRYGFSHNSSGCAAMLFDSYSELVDISSDSTWLAFVHPSYSQMDVSPNIRLSESNIKYIADANLGNWHSINYDKVIPKALIINDSPTTLMGNLYPRPIPLWRYSDLMVYDKVNFDVDTRIMSCKLPYCSQVTPYLKIKSSKKNYVIDIFTDQDVVGEDQCVRCQYVTDEGIQEYENYGWMSGNTIYYRIPEGVEVEEVKYRESGYDCDIVGSFNCSDEFINELWVRSARTLYINMRDNYMDCPDRERAQWWGDVVNEIQEVPYVMSQSAKYLTGKAILELVAWQRSDDVLYSPIPANAWFNELPVQSLMAVGLYGFYSHYILDGDTEFIEKIYKGVHRYLHNVWEIKPNGIINKRTGDWDWGDWGENVDIELLQICWYYLALEAELYYANMLEKHQDAKEIEDLLYLIKRNFISNYWKGNEFRSERFEGNADDRANALAVLCGFAEERMYPKILNILKNNIYASPLLELYVFRAMCKMGFVSDAIQRAKNRYALMVNNKDLTTICEHFSIVGGSINHAWGAWIPVVMAEEICGIHATSAGFKTIELRPNLGGLNYISTGFETAYGRIETLITPSSIDITIPDNTEAHIIYNNIDKKVSSGYWHFDCDNANHIVSPINKNNKIAHIYNISGQKSTDNAKGIKIIKNRKYIIR